MVELGVYFGTKSSVNYHSYDVTKGSLCGNTEPDFPNQKKERTSETLQHVCDSPKTENPRPTLDRSEDVLTAIGTLSQTTGNILPRRRASR